MFLAAISPFAIRDRTALRFPVSRFTFHVSRAHEQVNEGNSVPHYNRRSPMFFLVPPVSCFLRTGHWFSLTSDL